MPHDPLRFIAEILGEPGDEMRNPANAEYRCPFIASTCTKRGHLTDDPIPVCSIYRPGKAGTAPTRPPVCICPNRLLEADIMLDVIEHCWVGDSPRNPHIVREVNMEKFGSVDFVIADVDKNKNVIREFVSVELQAVDTTGKYFPAYEAAVNNRLLKAKPTYGFNWGNVRKRLISQLITKGFYHHHWQTRIVAVLQTDLFDMIHEHSAIPKVSIESSNIVFLLYQFVNKADRWEMKLDDVVPTTQASLMLAAQYETPPSKSAFKARILERLNSE